MSVVKIKLNAKQLADLVKQRSSVYGPWPRNMSVLIYPLDGAWRAMIGYTDIAQTDFKNSVEAMSAELSAYYELVD